MIRRLSQDFLLWHTQKRDYKRKYLEYFLLSLFNVCCSSNGYKTIACSWRKLGKFKVNMNHLWWTIQFDVGSEFIPTSIEEKKCCNLLFIWYHYYSHVVKDVWNTTAKLLEINIFFRSSNAIYYTISKFAVRANLNGSLCRMFV